MGLEFVDGVLRQAATEILDQTHRRTEALGVAVYAVADDLAVTVGQLGRAPGAQVGRVPHRVCQYLAEYAADLHAGVVGRRAHAACGHRGGQRLGAAALEAHRGGKLLENLAEVFAASGDKQLRLLPGDIVGCEYGVDSEGNLAHGRVIQAMAALSQGGEQPGAENPVVLRSAHQSVFHGPPVQPGEQGRFRRGVLVL